MSHLFGLDPEYFLAGPVLRWERYRAWADDYQRQMKEANRG